MVPKENAMNLIYGLQRNQTKVWYEELAYAHKYHIESTGSIFWPCDEKKETETSLRTGLILKEKAAGERSEKR